MEKNSTQYHNLILISICFFSPQIWFEGTFFIVKSPIRKSIEMHSFVTNANRIKKKIENFTKAVNKCKLSSKLEQKKNDFFFERLNTQALFVKISTH